MRVDYQWFLQTAAQRGVLLSLILLLGACAGTSPYEINLMPASEVYEVDVIDPFADATPLDDLHTTACCMRRTGHPPSRAPANTII